MGSSRPRGFWAASVGCCSALWTWPPSPRLQAPPRDQLPTSRAGPGGTAAADRGRHVRVCPFLSRADPSCLKVGDSQSQETSQTSQLCGDAEAPVNRKQTCTVSLPSPLGSKHVPRMRRGVAISPTSNLGRGDGRFTKVTFIFPFYYLKRELGV